MVSKLVRGQMKQPVGYFEGVRHPGGHSAPPGLGQQEVYRPEVDGKDTSLIPESVLKGQSIGKDYFARLLYFVGVRCQGSNCLSRELNCLAHSLKYRLHLVLVVGAVIFANNILLDELCLDGSWPKGDHGDIVVLQFKPTVRCHSVAASLSHTVGNIEKVSEPTRGGDIDNEAAPVGGHDPAGIGGANVVPPQSYTVDAVPNFNRVGFMELLARILEYGADPGIGVVDQHVQLTILLQLDPLKQGLHI